MQAIRPIGICCQRPEQVNPFPAARCLLIDTQLRRKGIVYPDTAARKQPLGKRHGHETLLVHPNEIRHNPLRPLILRSQIKTATEHIVQPLHAAKGYKPLRFQETGIRLIPVIDGIRKGQIDLFGRERNLLSGDREVDGLFLRLHPLFRNRARNSKIIFPAQKVFGDSLRKHQGYAFLIFTRACLHRHFRKHFSAIPHQHGAICPFARKCAVQLPRCELSGNAERTVPIRVPCPQRCQTKCQNSAG